MTEPSNKDELIANAIVKLHEHWRDWDRKLWQYFVDPSGGAPDRNVLVTVPPEVSNHSAFEECRPGDEAARLDVASGAYEAVRKLRSTDIVLDIGAHIGCFTERALQADAVVHAVEPDPRNFRMLSRLYGQHKYGLRLHAYQVAAGDENRVVELRRSIFSTQHRIVDNERWLDANAPPPVRVQMLALDTLGLQPTFIKIDVEEAEYMVLAGLNWTLRMIRPFVAIEVTADMDLCAKYLSDCGYTIQAQAHMHLEPAPMVTPIAGLWHCTPKE